MQDAPWHISLFYEPNPKLALSEKNSMVTLPIRRPSVVYVPCAMLDPGPCYPV